MGVGKKKNLAAGAGIGVKKRFFLVNNSMLASRVISKEASTLGKFILPRHYSTPSVHMATPLYQKGTNQDDISLRHPNLDIQKCSLPGCELTFCDGSKCDYNTVTYTNVGNITHTPPKSDTNNATYQGQISEKVDLQAKPRDQHFMEYTKQDLKTAEQHYSSMDVSKTEQLHKTGMAKKLIDDIVI